jgi:hypothetical protein
MWKGNNMADVIDPKLSRFNPLSRIICFDDFDRGLHGWTGLIGNYEKTLNAVLPEYRDLRPPMLSNGTMWDTGSAGSWDGTYAMKLATRPKSGSLAVAVKRLTWRFAGPIRMEAYVTFKPEATELELSELDVRTFGFLWDLQNGTNRVMPHLRYLNALDGERVSRWQFKKEREPVAEIGESGKTISHFHLAATGWEDIPAEPQLMCYNEIATKQNWHYMCVDFDLDTMAFTGFQFNDRVYDVSQIAPMTMPAMANLWCMLNMVFFVETDCDKRASLSVDSVMISGEWD